MVGYSIGLWREVCQSGIGDKKSKPFRFGLHASFFDDFRPPLHDYILTPSQIPRHAARIDRDPRSSNRLIHATTRYTHLTGHPKVLSTQLGWQRELSSRRDGDGTDTGTAARQNRHGIGR